MGPKCYIFKCERVQMQMFYAPRTNQKPIIFPLCDVVNSASCVFTFLDDVDDVICIEAELICVLSIIGIKGFALGHLGLGFGGRFGSPPSWGWSTDRLSLDTEE